MPAPAIAADLRARGPHSRRRRPCPPARTGAVRTVVVLPARGRQRRPLRHFDGGHAAPQRVRLLRAQGTRITAPGSRAPVHVLETDDVVLTEVAAGLHFDQLDRLGAAVAQAMDAAERDVGAL